MENEILARNIGQSILQISQLQEINKGLSDALDEAYLILARYSNLLPDQEVELLKKRPVFQEYVRKL